MDLQKFGILISKLRKNNNLTQNDIGTFLGVSSKTVSKWERGISAPDISLLNKLSELLGISTTDLLNCNETSLNKKISKDNNSLANHIKDYSKNLKKRYNKKLKKVTVIFIIIVFIILLLFSINNFNRFSVFSIKSNNFDFELDGIIISNQSKNKLVIGNIHYISKYVGTEKEPQVSKLTFSLYEDNKIIYINDYEYNDNYHLSDAVLELYVNIDDNIKNREKIINLKKDDNLLIVINCLDNNNNSFEFKIPLSLSKEFANNKIFY